MSFTLKGLHGAQPLHLFSLCGPHVIHVDIGGATMPDGAGNHMHLLYTKAAIQQTHRDSYKPLVPNSITSESVPKYPRPEFDARGDHELCSGDIYLVGGSPDDTYTITAWAEPLKHVPAYAYHWLSTWVTDGLAVPAWHSVIRAARAGSPVRFSSGGFDGFLDAIPLSLWGSEKIVFGEPVLVQTAWRGC